MTRLSPITRSTARLRRVLLSAGLAVAAISAGCWTEGGVPISLDRYTYKSTPTQPKTITLVDIRTGEQIWSYDIPVGKRLSLQFVDDKLDDTWRPSVMRWDVAPGDSLFGELKNQIAVPFRTR